MYKVADSVVLTSGRKVPIAGRSDQRGGGVTIVLSGPTIQVWMNSGNQGKAWRARLVPATLDCGECFHVLSCYAPTFAAKREDKDNSSSRCYFFNSIK